MADRVPSDHPTVDSQRVALESVGSTSRPQLLLPDDLTCAIGDFVRLSVDGTWAHAEVVSTLSDGPALRGAYPNRRLARTREGTDLLGEWFDKCGLSPGGTLVLDVVTAGYAYGLREPGTTTVYDPVDRPSSSLADIAASLDE